jgi:hypothetical protein
MALLHESVEFKMLDVRLIERNVARGVLTQDQVAKAQEQLPDDADNAEWVSIDSLSDEGETNDVNNGKGSAH